MDATIIVLSNTSIDQFPNNSLTKFTLLLPDSFHIPTTEKLAVSLSSLTISTDLQEEQPTPAYIKVHLSELRGQQAGSGVERCLAAVPFDNKHSVLHHECNNPHFLPLGQNSIRSLTFHITDENNKTLQLETAHATALVINLKKMNSSQFSIVADSHSSLNTYPNNRVDEFEVLLPEELQLEANKWEVAVTDFIMPADIGQQQHFDEPYIEIDNNTHTFELEDYEKEESLTREIKQILQSSKYGHELEFDTFNTLVDAGKLPERYRHPPETDSYVLLRCDTDAKELVHITISQVLSYVLGDYSSKKSALLRRKISLGPLNMIVFRKMPDLSRAYIDSFLLYADFVKPSIVGNLKTPVLQIIPAPPLSFKSMMYIYQPKNFIFQDVSKTSFRSIKFMGRTLHGKALVRNHNYAKNEKVTVSLLFRKKTD